MRYQVKLRRLNGAPHHLIHFCPDIEKAVELTREQYPGCLIINVEGQPTNPLSD